MTTVQAPHSPSAQPSLAPVRPRARRNSNNVVCGLKPSARTVLPLRRNSSAMHEFPCRAILAIVPTMRIIQLTPLVLLAAASARAQPTTTAPQPAPTAAQVPTAAQKAALVE